MGIIKSSCKLQVASCRFFILSSVFCLLSSSSFAQVIANFSAAPTSGCAPLVVQFTDLSTGNPTSWNWNLGNGNPSTSPNPNTIYSLPGVYTVTLTVSNGISTDTEIKTNYIVVYNNPQTGFTMSNDTACVGQTVTFTDATVISPGGSPIGIWLWDFGDGNTQTAFTSTTTHFYSAPGNYPVSLLVNDTNGCAGDSAIVHSIVIVPVPTPSFTATPTFACVPPLTVAFTNNSTTVGTTTYSWNFGDGNTSTQFNPSNTYTLPGTYAVTLIVNQNGCIDSVVMQNYITIQNIAASFVATPTVVCSGQPVTFTNTSIPSAATANWNFGDANTSTAISPTHTYTTAGTYTVTMTATDANGCTGTSSVIITVNQTPVANFTADTTVACNVPFTVTFTNTSTGGTNYFWNFGDGNTSTATNPSNTYASTGSFVVTLIVTNSSGPCSATIVMTDYIIISPPVANFTHAPDSGCVPLTVTFNGIWSVSTIDPIATYSWSFGDGNNAASAVPVISNTYTATGVYTVTLIIQTANGCTDTMVCLNCIKVGTPPVANFGIFQDTICYGMPVNFSDSSTGNVTGWYWSFGDGGTSVLQNPIYVYGDTGTYPVYLIAYSNGCSDTSILQNVVILPPKAIFTYALNCTNYYTVQFTSTSEGADSLFWNFGDGSLDSSNSINPVHTYTVTGPYTVSLTAYNYSTGCSNTVTATFTIAEPIASYSVNPAGCYPFTANFISTSQDANIYWWNFGDPSTNSDTSIIANPSYTYNNPAAYTVTFIITDVNGCRDTLIDTVKSLGPLPYFYADTLAGCRPFLVTFIDTSVSDSVLTQWTWDFGDLSPIVTTNNDSIIHTYLLPGIYSVTMTVTDTNGCVKTIIKTNYIQPTFPFPAFTVDTFACKFDVLTFDASATSVVGGTYMWNYGDGTGDTTTNPIVTHTYTSDSLYIVSLTVTDINGCDSALTDTIRILQPAANFNWSATDFCGYTAVHFTDSSTGYVTNWYWDFGDGATATTTVDSVDHNYTTAGVYNVTLIVTNAGGCKDTLQLDSIIVTAWPAGTFTFTPSSGCNPLTVCFDANGLNATIYMWDFGDGSPLGTSGSICHTYTWQNTFTPVLILGNTLPNGNSCLLTATNLSGSVNVTNVLTDSILVNGVVTDSITVPQDSVISVNVTYSGGTAPYTYNWSPGTGINCTTCSSVFIIGTGDTILYTFTIYNSSGCIGIDSIWVYSEPCFEEKLIPNVFSPNGDGVNDVFHIPGVCPDEKYFFAIYDRWGVLLFSTTLRNNGWDGRTNAGLEAKEGVYYFVITLAGQKDQNGLGMDDTTYRGFVHLVR